MRDSIALSVYFDAEPRDVELDGRRRSRSRDARRTSSSTSGSARRGGAFTVALTNDVDSVLAREAEAVLPLAAGEERAVAATKTYIEPGRRARTRSRDIAADRRARRGRHPLASPASSRARCPRSRQQTRELAAPFAFVGRMLVIGRGPGVRDRTRDRAEAARDVQDRGVAADRDRPRARAGRRARPAVPGLGDRLARRDAAGGAGGRRARARVRRDDRRQRRRGRRDRGRGLRPAGARARSCRSSRRSSRSCRGSSSRRRSRGRRGTTPTARPGCRRSRSRASARGTKPARAARTRGAGRCSSR